MSARRRVTRTLHCGHKGCSERAHYEYATRREADEAYRRDNGQWLCIRHSRPDEMLSLTNTKIVTVTGSVRPLDKYPNSKNRFWGKDSGFIHDPGFRAFAEDFPDGTRLRITVEVVLPDEGGEP